jgi:hypothetical protein
MTASLPEKAEALPFEEAARKDSAVHVSLSSDSPVKHPGTGEIPSKNPVSDNSGRNRSRRHPTSVMAKAMAG